MCPFVPRCNYAREKCEQKNPPLLEVTPGHYSACWFWEEVSKETDQDEVAMKHGHPAPSSIEDFSLETVVPGAHGVADPNNPLFPAQRRISTRTRSRGSDSWQHPNRQRHPAATGAEPQVAANGAKSNGAGESLLTVNNLVMHFPLTQGIIFQRKVGAVQAVDGISFDVKQGETLGLVGESGCGKSTTGRAILQLYKPTAGEVIFNGKDLTKLNGGEMRKMRRHLQMIFQDPYASLNPRMTVGNIVSEPMQIHNLVPRASATSACRNCWRRSVSIPTSPTAIRTSSPAASGSASASPARWRRTPTSSSPTSRSPRSTSRSRRRSSTCWKICRSEFGLTYLFIAHDLSVVKHISDRVAVMYLGKIVEMADRNELYEDPLHPYTKALLSAVPIPDPVIEKRRERIILTGDVPSPINPPSGCHFHTRCPYAMEVCRQIDPVFADQGNGHFVACHLYSGFRRRAGSGWRGEVPGDLERTIG